MVCCPQRTALVAPKPLRMIVRVTMDLFEHRYYRLNKTLMKLIGQWPYQNARARYCFRAVIIYVNTSEILSRILDVVKHRNDFGIILECAVPLFADCVSVTNLIVLMLNSQKVWAGHREVHILHKYAEQGQKINILLTALVYFSVCADGTSLLMTKIIDAMLMNDTRPGKFPSRVDNYRVDAQKYYFYVMVYYCVMLIMIIMVIIVNNLMLVSYVQHACGIFAALGQKLERIGTNDTSIVTREAACALGKRDIVQLTWCIDRHNDAIEYANLIEGINTWNIGITMVFGILLVNVLGLQILTSIDDLEATGRLLIFSLSLLFGFILDCYVAQKLMDHSANIAFHIYNNRWYRLSHEAQKFVQLITMRCIVPCQLTAGKILILSMNTCALTIRTGLSYFTILRSTRGL